MLINQSIVLFDGFCNLCNATVDFVMKHDRKNQFTFLPLQSESAKDLRQKYDFPELTDSVILIKSDKVFTESDAIVEIAEMLGFPWKFAVVLKILPLKFRNKIYRWVANNRYRWFGKRESCKITEI